MTRPVNTFRTKKEYNSNTVSNKTETFEGGETLTEELLNIFVNSQKCIKKSYEELNVALNSGKMLFLEIILFHGDSNYGSTT